MFISLEPCFHHGKTPPCVNKIIEFKIPEVFIALADPNPKVNGKSIALMREHGIKVHVGTLKEEAKNLLKIFRTNIEQQRPYVCLKFAQSADGFIAKINERTQISDQYSHRLVHKWRSEVDAILVGTNTAICDNPKLTTRDFSGSSPIRVIIDRSAKVPQDYHIFDGSTPTIIFISGEKSSTIPHLEYIPLINDGNEIQQILKALFERNVSSLLVEGGTQIHKSFIKANLWDEARIFTNPQLLKYGVSAPSIKGELITTKELVTDSLAFFKNPN
jgi:diaminohydroxyphosphoribosylaminopyrimidine deaminase/5-amino-6-(5-phosphoribosylamino)uracil reductase